MKPSVCTHTHPVTPNTLQTVQLAPGCQSSCVIKGMPQTNGIAQPAKFRRARFRPSFA